MNCEYFDPGEKEETVVTRPEESKVIHAGGDQIIITPYYKQLSWLFKTLHDYVIYGNQLSAGIFLSGFYVGCEGYFIMNPSHSAKELMAFVLDGLQRMVDASRESERSHEK